MAGMDQGPSDLDFHFIGDVHHASPPGLQLRSGIHPVRFIGIYLEVVNMPALQALPSSATLSCAPSPVCARAERQHSKRAKKWADEQLVVLTGIPTEACNTPWGDHLISLGVQNKQDWARLHGHELHLMASSTDLRIRPGAWQKVALLRQVCRVPSLLHMPLGHLGLLPNAGSSTHVLACLWM